MTGGGMRHFAVVGSGPAGFYTAEALEKAYGDQARIDILDRYPVPYGLIRFGVAPDHQSLKAVSKRYDKVAESAGVDFIGNVTVGRDVSVAELLDLYDAVILATGAPHDRKLGIPGEDLARRGRLGGVRRLVQRPSRFRRPRSAARRHACGGRSATAMSRSIARASCRRRAHEFEGSDIVGHALDALDESAIRTVTILGRRGPHQIAMTPKELGELGHLEAAVAGRRSGRFPAGRSRRGARARACASRSRSCAALPTCRRRTSPSAWSSTSSPSRFAIEGDGKAERIIVERTELDDKGAARGTGETYEVPASLIVTAIGYSTLADPRRSVDERAASSSTRRAASPTGSTPSAGRGAGRPGTIGTNRPDGYEVADQIAAAMPPGARGDRPGAEGLKRLLEERGVMPTDYDDWRKIEETETGRARPGSPREKFVRARATGCRRSAAECALALRANPHLSSRGLGSRRDLMSHSKRVPVGE